MRSEAVVLVVTSNGDKYSVVILILFGVVKFYIYFKFSPVVSSYCCPIIIFTIFNPVRPFVII